jgi:hypothetical protein
VTPQEQVEAIYAESLSALNRSNERMTLSAFLLNCTEDRLAASRRDIEESWKALQAGDCRPTQI